jgi:hypothetical protein
LLPQFRTDCYLPDGLHNATEAELTFRFGSATSRRRRLVLRLRRWLFLARDIGAHRLLIDGSFVTAKPEPGDIDAVILLPANLAILVRRGHESAIELDQMLLTRRPEELFAAEDESDWNDWYEFFSRTREPDGRRKGLVKMQLGLTSPTNTKRHKPNFATSPTASPVFSKPIPPVPKASRKPACTR